MRKKSMAHIHKHFTMEQIKVLLEAYKQGCLSRDKTEKTLGISKTKFFAFMKNYRTNPDDFSIKYERKNHSSLSECDEEKIEKERSSDPTADSKNELFVLVLLNMLKAWKMLVCFARRSRSL